MPNTLTFFDRISQTLDQMFKAESKSAILTSGSGTWNGVKTVRIPTITTQSLGNYSRVTGYPDGDITVSLKDYTPEYDRGVKFTYDAMDNDEVAGLLLAQTLPEFERTRVIPELDAYRFSLYVNSITNSDNVISLGGATTGAAVLEAILQIKTVMDDNEIPEMNRHLFLTSEIYNQLIGTNVYTALIDPTASKGGFQTITSVPKTRLYKDITLQSTPNDLTYLVDYPFAGLAVFGESVYQEIKHQVSPLIQPEFNATHDGYIQKFRVYAANGVYANKTDGIVLLDF